MIKIICVGKIKEKYINDGINEYLKRLSAFEKIEIVEVKEYNNKDIETNISLEGKEILSKINEKDYCITLEILGKNIDSISFAYLLNDLKCHKSTNISLIIGGSNGLSNEVKERSNCALSFSNMTFPHQLMRLILLEQVYRAYTILNNKEYHK